MTTDSVAPLPLVFSGTESAPDPRDWLSAIIAGSDDAIISKNLEGNIQSWNASATRLFGYTAEEVIGRPITILIPDDRLDEEPRIIAAIREGKRVEHFETKRRRKDGSLIDLSLTISPIRNASGVIVGASKIARDITERRKAQEAQSLILSEMRHRIKNLFTLTGGIVALGERSGADKDEVLHTVRDRLAALARAHDLTMADHGDDGLGEREVSLADLLEAVLRPYEGLVEAEVKVNHVVTGRALSNIALLLHELATNAAKYGCLSVLEGHLEVHIEERDDELGLVWVETGGPQINPPETTGFGSRLQTGLVSALGATLNRDWRPEGLCVTLTLPKAALAG